MSVHGDLFCICDIIFHHAKYTEEEATGRRRAYAEVVLDQHQQLQVSGASCYTRSVLCGRWYQSPADMLAMSPETVEREARRTCRHKATDKLILANSQLQFGKYWDQTFQWVLENDVGYAVGVVTNVEKEADMGTGNRCTSTSGCLFSKPACSRP